VTTRIPSVQHRWRRSNSWNPIQKVLARPIDTSDSLAKSAIRLMGYGCMMAVDVPIIVLAGVLLAGAEVLGILEEL
jgi:hypothetical protein